MTRIVRRLDDYRPLLAALEAGSPGLAGTELVDCTEAGCRRAVVVAGPQDVQTMLELVDDEGWALVDRRWRCPEHGPRWHRH